MTTEQIECESCLRCGAVMEWRHQTWQCRRCGFKLGCCEGLPQSCDASERSRGAVRAVVEGGSSVRVKGDAEASAG